ncbi:DUF2076 domain-containing protein [Bordetella sp. 15P40C-2]|uniref:DUF2076 domain-containing protein n=1 Tax=Bordetella sp. 15P40C-2 TaxID=2572246 RepID=UPI0013663D42|nr:DUF2076 domain-containing protein [Bordetella sp. 15P40C-2]
MNEQDRNAIESVFNRIREVEKQAPQRDPEAEQLIRQELQKNPGSAYYLAQTVLVQQEALKTAQARLQELEKAPAQASRPATTPPTGFGRSAAPREPAKSGMTTGFGRSAASPAGGGFMAGAMQTALGVAGGMMLGNLLGNLFTGNNAHAAEPPPQDEPAPAQEEAAPEQYDDGFDYSDDGGDMDV